MGEKPDKIRVAIIAGAFIGVVSGVPGLNIINCCCCAGIVLGGLLSMYLYLQEFRPETPPIESSDALILGVMTGVAGAFAVTIVEQVVFLLFGSVNEEFVRGLLERVIQFMEEGGGLPAEAAEEMRDEIERSLQGSKTFQGILSGLFITLILYPIFSILGALIGYSIFKRKRPVETMSS